MSASRSTLPRRALLAGVAGSFAVWAARPHFAYAGQRDPRFAVVILRGALDGLAVVPPVGDPAYAALRGPLAIGADGREILPLDGFFALNDAMPALHARYRAGQVVLVQATATPYRERSHFDGQDVLESGQPGPRSTESGWLNRVASALPTGETVRPFSGLAIGATVPLILRGPSMALTWSPPQFKAAGSDTLARLAALYGEQDAELSRLLAAGAETDRLAAGQMGIKGGGQAAAFRAAAEGAGRLLAQADGPRLAAISFDGWDTHANEGAETGRLAMLLGALDGALAALADSLGPAWAETVVVVVTEFGRTARGNGSIGTDHGTGTLAMLLGGAVKGGRMIADWPGLKDADLYEQRDLKPTLDLRAVLKGVLRDHLGLDAATLGTHIFPESLAIAPLDGLVA